MFHVGQKVVCIVDVTEGREDLWVFEHLGIMVPEKGTVYTVRATVQALTEDDTSYGLLLEEIVNPVVRLTRSLKGGRIADNDPLRLPDGETAFAATAFRPLLTVKDFVATRKREPLPA